MTQFQINQDTILTVPLFGAAVLLKPIFFIGVKYYCVLLGTELGAIRAHIVISNDYL